jgi:PAS domain S-box-containing protein
VSRDEGMVKGEVSATSASFDNSLVPMLVADDRRHFVAANRAACLLLRLRHDEVLQLTIDDLTPPESRSNVDRLWEAFLRDGTQSGTYELLMPDGPRMRVEYSAKANIETGRHLSIFLVPAAETEDPPADRADARRRLTLREREVLALIAMGNGSFAIAAALQVSPSTVETHVRHCLAKLGANNRAHAIALGLQHGEIDLNVSARPPRIAGGGTPGPGDTHTRRDQRY